MYMCVLICVRLFAILWTVAYQDHLSMRFSRQEYWSGLPFLLQGIFPDPEIEPTSPTSPALVGGSLPLIHLGSFKCTFYFFQ